MEPLVSVPIETAAIFAATAAAAPELDPPTSKSPYGFFTCPPRELHPFRMRSDIKFAHSVIFVLPNMTAPASRSFFTKKASSAAKWFFIANEPQLVCMPSPVSILSFNSIGMPCNNERTIPRRRSSSSDLAIWRACGFNSSMALIFLFLSAISLHVHDGQSLPK